MPGLSDRARREFRIHRIGLIFQAFELLEYLTVRDNILLPYWIGHALDRPADADARLEQLAAEMDIAERLTAIRLSQGERQRAAICRALITSPELILADEPTGNRTRRTSSACCTCCWSRRRSSWSRTTTTCLHPSTV